MPPRKRTRVSAATTPLRETQAKAPSVAAGEKPTPAPVVNQNDLWTDEEEALLFKSLVRWKPTGTVAILPSSVVRY
jgi:MRG-binding protein